MLTINRVQYITILINYKLIKLEFLQSSEYDEYLLLNQIQNFSTGRMTDSLKLNRLALQMKGSE